MLNVNSLNDAQRKAVMHGKGPLLVLAGPGSGKTYTIIQRIFFLLEEKAVSPEKILVITFTRDAAVSMQRRFLEDSNQTFPVNFGTFHSVFYHILKESNFANSLQILTDSQKKNLIIPIIKKYISKEEVQNGLSDLSEEAIEVLAAISFYKNTGNEEAAKKKLSIQRQADFQRIFHDYENERRRRKTIDFDDMVYECQNMLAQKKELLNDWQQRFEHILIDEFQDINPMQYEVIRLLAQQNPNLFAVGDDDQAIYGFRGSQPACIKRFVQDYSAKQVCLDVNYRSKHEIVKASLAVIGENKDRFRKKIQASQEQGTQAKPTEEVVKLSAFAEREEQYQYLINRLQNQKEGESIGVLFRTNSYMQGLATRLSKEGIPYVMKENSGSIYEHFLVKDIVAYIKLASGKGSRSLFLQIMNRPSRYIGREVLRFTEKVPTYRELIQYYRKRGLNSYNMQVIWNLEKWEKQMQYLAGLSPYLAVQYIRRVIGYDAYAREKSGGKREKWQEWQECLDWLCTDAANYRTITDWFEAQEAYTKEMSKKKKEGNLFLITVHGAKGLEFDRVYIPDCNERVFPYGSLPDEKQNEEERRIFYVAMTRAKKSLELLYLTGTKERPRLPSRFLNKLL